MTLQAPLYDISGTQIGVVDLPEIVWAIEPNEPVMHQALVRQQANARLGTVSTLNRRLVSGGGRKPWRQKGTGRARQGSIRAPQWRHGAVVFGPHPRSYYQAMPKKMRRLALRSALSARLKDGDVRFVDGLDRLEPRTKAMAELLRAQGWDAGKTLLVLPPGYDNVKLAAFNLPQVKTLHAGYLNVRDLLAFDHILVSSAALDVIHSYLSKLGRTP
jgi:large subunit ribosomal protein L4